MNVPDDLPSGKQQKYDRLAGLSSKQFDRAYVRLSVKGHKQARDLFRKEKASHNNARVSQMAATGLPVIKGHLRKAKDMANDMNIDVSD
ncbi:DUF4142 domain-containing protein [Salinisphaera sp.]|uniref:DUF4142 domain-containing protein n=1 Tax=Salinisphaera sp. TaxID=1914330 RepID=UPI002D77B068|nr:DUF4142 domain-containing protein [Salinisphaera sp.]HET7312791.1 DUF4142 domain-containing protein [Salinisphaera sp.]